MKKYTKIICLIAAVCLLGTAAFCGFRIYSHYAHESEQEEVFEKIAEVVEQAQTGESETTDVLLTEEETVLAEYGELYLQNTDMVGWLSIAGTNINYPVMQTPNNPNYYLKHNFEKEYSDLGTPYVQENCDLLTSDNLVIYGHHIKGQKMFGALENYKSKDFYEEHKTFHFDTLTKRGEYEIIAVFKTVAYSSAGFIYTITSNDGSVQGLIKEIDDGGMVVEKKTGELEIINLDFVTRIRQYPRKKNGKKKDIVLD